MPYFYVENIFCYYFSKKICLILLNPIFHTLKLITWKINIIENFHITNLEKRQFNTKKTHIGFDLLDIYEHGEFFSIAVLNCRSIYFILRITIIAENFHFITFDFTTIFHIFLLWVFGIF